ncbi:MAG: hypothetical protein ACTSVI_06360 [Promethearchaeota archaeon]
MNRKEILALNSISIGTIAILTLFINELGFIIQKLSNDDYIYLLLLCVGYPLAMSLVSQFNKKVVELLLFSCAIIAIASNYFILMDSPNYIIPTFSMNSLTLVMFFLFIGSCTSVFVIGTSMTMEKLNDAKGFELHFSASVAIGFTIGGLLTTLGSFGWLYPLMMINYVLPASILVYFLLLSKDAGHKKETRKSKEDVTKDSIVVLKVPSLKDNTKGLKLTFFIILAGLLLFLVIGINGVGTPNEDFYQKHWIFWIGTGGGFILFMSLFWKTLNVGELGKNADITIKIEKDAQVKFLILASMITIAAFASIILNLYATGYHGSLAGYILDGMMNGVILSCTIIVLVMMQPPKAKRPFLAMMMFFIVFAMFLGCYLKTTTDNFTEVLALSEYFPYVFGILIIVFVLLLIPILITIAKKSRSLAKKATNNENTVEEKVTGKN